MLHIPGADVRGKDLIGLIAGSSSSGTLPYAAAAAAVATYIAEMHSCITLDAFVRLQICALCTSIGLQMPI